MTNAEYYGFSNSNGYFKFTKHIDHIPKGVKDMNIFEFLRWLSSEKAPELTASEKRFLADIVNAYNDTDLSNTFSCFRGMFTELEEGKAYNIRKLLGKDC